MSKRRGYFKHFNSAYEGSSFLTLMKEKEYFAGHFFWAILGRANQLGTGFFTERISYFSHVLSVTRPKLVRNAFIIQTHFEDVSIEIQTNTFQISIGNYAKYQENRGGKRDGFGNPKKEVLVAHDNNNNNGNDNNNKKTKAKKALGPTAEKLFEIYNAERQGLPAARSLSTKRTKLANARLVENPDLDYWTEVIRRIASSDFCNGKNDRSWQADFDFILRPDTHLKALEGKYDNRLQSSKIATNSWLTDEVLNANKR